MRAGTACEFLLGNIEDVWTSAACPLHLEVDIR